MPWATCRISFFLKQYWARLLPLPSLDPRFGKIHRTRQRSPGKRSGIKQQTAYLALPVYEQVRRLAFEENTKMHPLLIEGLDRVFKDRGLPSIAELTGQKALISA